ncbi:MAG: zinc ribbon domain-containing protein [Actinomycetota bacterium]
MECPSCGAEVREPDALFCARCGTPLKREDEASTAPPTDEQSAVSTGQGREPGYDPGPAPGADEPPVEGAVTARRRPGPPDRPSIESPYGGYQGGQRIEQPNPTQRTDAAESKGSALPVREFAVALQKSFVSGGWGQFAGAAAIGWLTLVGLGALIVAAAAIGSGGFPGINALDVLSLVVVFGLSIMGVSLEFSNLGPVGPSFGMIWFGALAIFGYTLSWATARVVAQRSPHSLRGLMIEGSKVALPFALYCLLAALLFKISDVGTLGASAPQALFLGLLWGALFGALGGLRSKEPLAVIWGRLLESAKSKRRSTYEGIAAAGVMLGTTALASAAAFLLIIIIALARGDSLDGLTIGSVVAALIVLALTLPNVLSLIAAVSLGAPLSGVADTLGASESISIVGFGGRTSGGLVLLLLLIPLLSCLLGGFSAYRQSLDRTKMIEVLVATACVYAGTLAVLALLNGFSFRGVEGVSIGVVNTNFLLVALLGLVWAALFGFAGWKLAEMQDPDAPRQPSQDPEHRQEQRSAPRGYSQEPSRPVSKPNQPAPPTTEHRGPSPDR